MTQLLEHSVTGVPVDLLIGDGWRAGEDGRTFPVHDPSTEHVLAEIADATENDAEDAVRAAAAAAADWRETSPRERSGVLLSAHRLMMQRREDLARLISLENGKCLADARAEIAYAAEYFRWYGEEAVRVRGELFTAPAGANRVLVDYEPVGVCALVTPWNFPAAMATRKIGPAIAAGCTAVLKPASETPLTALAIAGILLEAGLPAGVLNVITTTSSSRVVDVMLRAEAVRMLSFTGSTEVGRTLLGAAAGRVLKTAMELGGNAPFMVMDDAHLDDAIDGALVAKMRNGGQACTAANRFYVQDAVHDDFVDRLAQRLAAYRLGPGPEEETDCGPLINAAAVAKVDELVTDARRRGARVVLGGEPAAGTGHYYPPTILTDVDPDAAIVHEEIFGPVVAVQRFDDEDEAVRAANATEYGLVSYLYTGDLARGLSLCRRLEAGMVALNRGLVSDPAAPFGGVKQSGLGREGSHEGLLEYLEAKYVATGW